MASQAEPESSPEERTEYAVEYVLHGHTFQTQTTTDEAEAHKWCEALDGNLVAQTTGDFQTQPETSR